MRGRSGCRAAAGCCPRPPRGACPGSRARGAHTCPAAASGWRPGPRWSWSQSSPRCNQRHVSTEVTRRSVFRSKGESEVSDVTTSPAQCAAAVASGVIEADEEVGLLQHPRVLHHVARVTYTCSVLAPHVPISRVC